MNEILCGPEGFMDSEGWIYLGDGPGVANGWFNLRVAAPGVFKVLQAGGSRQYTFQSSHLAKPPRLANPAHGGLDGPGSEWPFDRRRAYQDANYRRLVAKTIHDRFIGGNWRYHARINLTAVLDDLAAAREMIENELFDEASLYISSE